jgi:hypothetical protein
LDPTEKHGGTIVAGPDDADYAFSEKTVVEDTMEYVPG